MIHLDDGRNAFRRPQPQHRDLRRRWDQIAIQRDNLERMPRQRQASNLGRAAIQNMKQHPLTLFDPTGSL